jgi:hypothetical protein
MNADRSYVTLSAAIFAIVGAAHLARAIAGWPIVIGGFELPMAPSWIVGLAALGLSGWAVAQLKRG